MADFTFEKATGGDINITAQTVTHKYRAYHVPDVLPGGDFFSFVGQVALAQVPEEIFEPSLGSLLYRQNIQVHENHYARDYDLTVPYGPLKKESGAFQIHIRGGGGTVNIKAGERQGGYGTDGGGLDSDEGDPAGKRDNGGIIAPDGADRIHGVDWPVTSCDVTISFRHPAGSLTNEYVNRVIALIGHPNNDKFLIWEAGEALLMDADVTATETETTARYHFGIERNVVEDDALTVGGISITEKKGWDVMSFNYGRDTDNGFGVRKIEYIEIVRPRPFKDYAAETGFGWGGSEEE